MSRLSTRPSAPCLILHGLAAWDGVACTPKLIAPALAAHVPVLYVDPPIGIQRKQVRNGESRWATRRVTQLNDRLWRLQTFVVPGKDRPVFRHVADVWLRRAIQVTLREHRLAPIVTVATLPTRRVLSEAGGTSVYWITDDHAAGASTYGLPRRRIVTEERRLVAQAEALLASSPSIAERDDAGDRPVTVVPSGVDVESHRRPQPMPADWPTTPAHALGTAGYVGVLSDRVDIELLAGLADHGVHVVLIGPWRGTFDSPHLAQLIEHPFVDWLGPRPADALPAYMQCFDVGLIPYELNAYNHVTRPLKLFEYLAAGLPVVATPLNELRAMNTDLIDFAAEPASFRRTVATSISRRHDPQLVLARQTFANANSWTVRAATVAEALNLAEISHSGTTRSRA